jgi:hypothetical protein
MKQSCLCHVNTNILMYVAVQPTFDKNIYCKWNFAKHVTAERGTLQSVQPFLVLFSFMEVEQSLHLMKDSSDRWVPTFITLSLELPCLHLSL